MLGKLTKYSLWCPEHAETLNTDYRTEDQGEPTCCPLNEAHTNITGIAIVDVTDETVKKTKIVDTDALDPTKANTVEEGFVVEIEAGVNPSQLSISFAYPVDLLSGKYYVNHAAHELLDKMNVFIIPPGDAAIGQVAQAADIGAEEVYVDATALQSMKPGHFTRFQANATEYRILDIDYETGKLTLGTALDAAVAVGHTVHLRVPFVIGQLILKDVLAYIGDAACGSSNLPAGYTLRIDYVHATTPGSPAKLGFALAYKY